MRILTLICLFLAGCASNLTADERDWREGIDRENWRLCDRAYRQARKATIHLNHSHKYEDRRPVKHHFIRDDLMRNQCRSILRDYWADY